MRAIDIKHNLYSIGKRPPTVGKRGPDPYLTLEEERSLAEWIRKCAQRAMGKNRFLICQQVKILLDLSGRNVPVFKDNLPGKDWYQLFMRRNNLQTKQTEPLEIARAIACSEINVRKWYKRYLQMVIEGINDPKLIFNCDETGFPLQTKTGKVVGDKLLRSAYSVVSSDKKQITTLMCISAAGETLPPYVLFPSATKVNPAYVLDLPPGTATFATPTGWMNQDAFYNWVENCFIPNLPDPSKRGMALLLFDGHGSHIDIRTSTLCKENKAIPYALPPHTSHVTQPLDVCVFGPFKANWKHAINMFIHETGAVVDMYSLGRIFSNAYFKTVRPAINIKGFESTGLWPYNPEKINYSKMDASKTFPVTAEESQPAEVDFAVKRVTSAANSLTSLTTIVAAETVPPISASESETERIQHALSSSNPKPVIFRELPPLSPSPPPKKKPEDQDLTNTPFPCSISTNITPHIDSINIATPTTEVLQCLSPLKSKAAIALSGMENLLTKEEKVLFHKQYETLYKSTDALYCAWRQLKIEVDLLQRNHLHSIRENCMRTRSSASARKHLFKLPEHPRKKESKGKASLPCNLASDTAIPMLQEKVDKKSETIRKKKENADKRKVKLALKTLQPAKKSKQSQKNPAKAATSKISSKETRKTLKRIRDQMEESAMRCAKCDVIRKGGDNEKVWICCDDCDEWRHIQCTHNLSPTLSTREVAAMSNPWYCESCENENM